jgi:antitoxin FitA
MAQALIRNLDDDLVDDYREAAVRNGRSLEAEYRDALRRARPVGRVDRRRLADEVRSLLPEVVPGPTGTDLIRHFRDTDGSHWPDAAGR